jgi:hypothetical protein
VSSASVGILVVAYNAATTLTWTLDRIPDEQRARIAHVLAGCARDGSCDGRPACYEPEDGEHR